MEVWSPDAPFCPVCGTLLVLPDYGSVQCDKCPYTVPLAGMSTVADLRGVVAIGNADARKSISSEISLVDFVHASLSRFADMPKAAVVTQSYPKPQPEWYQEYAATLAAKAGDKNAHASKAAKRAVVNEECPKCKNPQMEYYTMQLRSADEGQTVFYECVKCGHKFSVNT